MRNWLAYARVPGLPTAPTLLFGATALAALCACSVYDESLLEPTGAGGATGATTTSSMSSNSGGATTGASCVTPADCDGVDSECGTRTCVNGACGVDAAPNGQLVAMQTAGDCEKNVCDGGGNISTASDDTDVKDDNKDCTVDACSQGTESHTPKSEGTSCTGTGNAKVCNTGGDCVECVFDSDCTSLVCNMTTYACAAAGCGDSVKNGTETDTDCGGSCPPCITGKMCGGNGDCESGLCVGGTCQPSCMDGVKNQNESDVDCGGVCGDCAFGQDCNVGTDCDTGSCNASKKCSCAPNNGVLLISEVKTRGVPGAADEFVELFNPGTTSVTFTSAWTIENRSETSASYTVRYTGTGQVVPPGGHLLIVGTAYSGSAAPDDTLASGITDEGSVVVKNAGATVDAVCFNCGMNQFSTHICEGTIVTKVGCTTNADKSIERKPGFPQSNCIDTQDNSADFAEITPSIPQGLASPLTP